MSIPIGHILLTLFAWPAGILLGNLLANLVWLPIQWAGLHLKLAAHHNRVHERFDDILARLDECPQCGHRRSAADLQPGQEPS